MLRERIPNEEEAGADVDIDALLRTHPDLDRAKVEQAVARGWRPRLMETVDVKG